MERTRLAVDFHDVQGLPGPLIPGPLCGICTTVEDSKLMNYYL